MFNLWQKIFYARKIRRLQQSFSYMAHKVLDISEPENSVVQLTVTSEPYYYSSFVGSGGLRVGFMVCDQTELRCVGTWRQIENVAASNELKFSGNKAVLVFRVGCFTHEVSCSKITVFSKGRFCIDDDTKELIPIEQVLMRASESKQVYMDILRKLKSEKQSN